MAHHFRSKPRDLASIIQNWEVLLSYNTRKREEALYKAIRLMKRKKGRQDRSIWRRVVANRTVAYSWIKHWTEDWTSRILNFLLDWRLENNFLKVIWALRYNIIITSEITFGAEEPVKPKMGWWKAKPSNNELAITLSITELVAMRYSYKGEVDK